MAQHLPANTSLDCKGTYFALATLSIICDEPVTVHDAEDAYRQHRHGIGHLTVYTE